MSTRRALLFKDQGGEVNPAYLIEDYVYYGESLAFDSGSSTFCFNTDGTKLFSATNVGVIKQYSMSTAYDITTLTYDSVSYTFTGANIRGMDMCSTNTRVMVMDNTINFITELDFTANDISTATVGNSFNRGGAGSSLQISPNGENILISDNTYPIGDNYMQYVLSTPNDITTASLYVTTQPQVDVFPFSSSFFNNGFSMLVGGASNNRIYQRNLPARYDGDTGTWITSVDSSLDVSAQSTGNLFDIRKTPDSTQVYFISTVSRKIYQYNL